MASTSDPTLTRVFIWSLPRSLGTAFVKCMSYVDGMQIFNEPFVSAFHFGPETVATNSEEIAQFVAHVQATTAKIGLENAFDDNICTYAWVKQQLEMDYPGKKILLVKDQAYCLNAKYDMIPSGFRHAFLIRHPYKVLPSWKRMLTKLCGFDNDSTSWVTVYDKSVKQPSPYEMQYNLLKYVKQNLDPSVVVFDADDLQRNTASILSQFCQTVNIPYTDTLLEWPAERQIMQKWKVSRVCLQGNLLGKEGGFYDGALMSTKFHPPKAVPQRSELSSDIQVAADNGMSFYECMREMCLKP